MLFLTNYNKESELQEREPGKEFKFAYNCLVSDNPHANDFFYCVEIKEEGSCYELGLEEFFQKILDHPYKKILFYIHGFNGLPQQSLKDVEKLQSFFKESEYLVIPIIWPSAKTCHIDKPEPETVEDGIMQKLMQFQKVYQFDRERAQTSSEIFTKLIEDFILWKKKCLKATETEIRPQKEINILAHSAGCRLLTYSVHQVLKRFAVENPPVFLENVFLVAPEMDYDVMQAGQPGHNLAALSKNLYLYFAINDIALTISMLGKEFDSADDAEKEIILDFVRMIVDYIRLGSSLKTNFQEFTSLVLSKRTCYKTRTLRFIHPILNFLGVRPIKLIMMLAAVIRVKKAKPSLGQVALKGMKKLHLFGEAIIPDDAPKNLSIINCTGKNYHCDTKLGHIYQRELDIYDKSSLIPGEIFNDMLHKLLNGPKEERFSLL